MALAPVALLATRAGPVVAETVAPRHLNLVAEAAADAELVVVAGTVRTVLGARSAASSGIQQRTDGTGMRRTTTTPKMKKRSLRRLMAHMVSTRTGTSTVVLPTTSPTSSRK